MYIKVLDRDLICRGNLSPLLRTIERFNYLKLFIANSFESLCSKEVGLRGMIL